MLKPFRFHIVLIFALIIGAIVLQFLLNAHYKSIEIENQDRLLKVHSDGMIRAETGLDIYAALVSSLRSHIKHSSELPSETQLQSFLVDLIKDLDFNDSIVISYLDTNHEFKYVFSPTQINAANLKGKKATDFRPKEEIDKLNDYMQTNEIVLYEPINLQEGWAGFPFNFGIQNNKGESLGYIAPIINVKYLLDYFYANDEEKYIHYFKINNKFDITREAVYDGTKIYNTKKDNQYYKNFNIDSQNFVSSNFDVFGINLEVGSAYKNQPKIKSSLAIVAYSWYILLIGFSILTLVQFFRNNKLNSQLKIANTDIEDKNMMLEKKIDHVQTLIKEIHHRIKNNMMMITGLIDMQSAEYQDKKIHKALEDSKIRIQSMSLIHEKLYGSESLKDIKVIDYIKQLIDFIEQTVKSSDIKIHKDLNIPSNLHFDGDTMVPLGLILNELITNSYKHSFKPNRNNELKIGIESSDTSYILTFSDNGPGISDEIDITRTTSLGMQLIMILTEELYGNVTYLKNDLSTFRIMFEPKTQS